MMSQQDYMPTLDLRRRTATLLARGGSVAPTPIVAEPMPATLPQDALSLDGGDTAEGISLCAGAENAGEVSLRAPGMAGGRLPSNSMRRTNRFRS
jgi:hypothetical protein